MKKVFYSGGSVPKLLTANGKRSSKVLINSRPFLFNPGFLFKVDTTLSMLCI